MRKYRLSSAQERLWFLYRCGDSGSAYNLGRAWWCYGRLSVHALEESLNRIIVRHEALRVVFTEEDGVPYQVVASSQRLALAVVDGNKSEIVDICQAELDKEFDLHRDLPIRGCLIKIADDISVVQITLHHIVADGWSLDILYREVMQAYSMLVQGGSGQLETMRCKYWDIVDQQRRASTDIYADDLKYWGVQLHGADEIEVFGWRDDSVSGSGRADLCLPDALTEQLSSVGREYGLSLFMIVLAAYVVVVSRWSGQPDVVVGTAVVGRYNEDMEKVVGLFANEVVLRVDLRRTHTVVDLVAAVRSICLDAYAHQEVPFDVVVQQLRPTRRWGRNPFFQVFLVLQGHNSLENQRAAGLRLEALPTRIMQAQFDLSLSVWMTEKAVRGELSFAKSCLSESDAERFVKHLHTAVASLVSALVTQAATPVRSLEILPAAERQQVLYEWNDTHTQYASDRCVHELFALQVEKTPQAIAVVFEQEELSYAELNRRANQLAHYLRQLGVRPDSRVAICVERSLEMVVALLAVLKAGGAYVPLDPAYPVDRLHFMIQDSEPVVLLTQQHLKALFSEWEETLPIVDLGEQPAPWEQQPESNPAPASLGLKPTHLAYVIYTSGSTGTPKGVMVEHRSVVNRLTWMQNTYCLDEEEIVLQKTSIAFDVSVWEFLWPLLYGAKLAMAGRSTPKY